MRPSKSAKRLLYWLCLNWSRRRYRLAEDGVTRKYEADKPAPVYGGASTWNSGAWRFLPVADLCGESTECPFDDGEDACS